MIIRILSGETIMDPIATLKIMRHMATEVLRRIEEDGSTPEEIVDDAESLAMAVEALDGWMKNGGFSPWAAKAA